MNILKMTIGNRTIGDNGSEVSFPKVDFCTDSGETLTPPQGIKLFEEELDILDIIDLIEIEKGVSYKWISGNREKIINAEIDELPEILKSIRDKYLEEGVNDAEMEVLMSFSRLENLAKTKSMGLVDLIEAQVINIESVFDFTEMKLGYYGDFPVLVYNGKEHYNKKEHPEDVEMGNKVGIKNVNYYEVLDNKPKRKTKSTKKTKVKKTGK